jgi:hypothetical protein
MYEWYYVLDRNLYKLRKAEYYSMQLKAMASINGRACEQVDLAKTNRQVKYVGLEPAGCVKLIQCAIDNVREGRGNERSRFRPLFV